MQPPYKPVPPLLIEEDDSLSPPRGVWLFIISLVIAKFSLIAVVLMWDFSPMSTLYVLLTTWTWLIVAGVLLSGPLTLAYRLRRVRARRRSLLQSEWMLND